MLLRFVEKTKVKGKYQVAIVDDVKVSREGNVRSAIVRYNSIRTLPQGKETRQAIKFIGLFRDSVLFFQ